MYKVSYLIYNLKPARLTTVRCNSGSIPLAKTYCLLTLMLFHLKTIVHEFCTWFYRQILLSVLHFVLKLQVQNFSQKKKRLLPFDWSDNLRCHCWLYIAGALYYNNTKLTLTFSGKYIQTGNFSIKCRKSSSICL